MSKILTNGRIEDLPHSSRCNENIDSKKSKSQKQAESSRNYH